MNTNANTNTKEQESVIEKPTRKPLTLDDVRWLDDDESRIVDIIRDLGNFSLLGATDELIIRQAKREGFSERRAKEILETLLKLGTIEYPYNDEYLDHTDITIWPGLSLIGNWENHPRLQNRKQLTSEDVYTLDEGEKHILEIIKDLRNLNLQATNELVIRQATRENFSKRKAAEILDNLLRLYQIKYVQSISSDDPFPSEPFIEPTSPEKEAAERTTYSIEMGGANKNAGFYEQAIRHYDEAIRYSPNASAAWRGKGEALEALGRKAEAKEAFEKARDPAANENKVGD